MANVTPPIPPSQLLAIQGNRADHGLARYLHFSRAMWMLDAVRAYQKKGCLFILSAQKTPRLVEALQAARWTGSPRTDADGQCEFRYQPEGWGQAYRFIALRYHKKRRTGPLEE